MNATVQQPKTIQPTSRHKRLVAGFAAVVAVAATAVATGLAGIDDVTREGEPPSAEAIPGMLTPAERAAVAQALTSPDPRRQRIAGQVATGQAGASALADPDILHHHGVDTSRMAVRDSELAAQRFHHR